MPAIRLPEAVRDADVVAAELAMTVRLTTHQIEQLWRGETVTTSDAPVERLARVLGCDVAALLVSSVAVANDSPQRAANTTDDRDEVYDDAPSVMFEQPAGGASKSAEREPVDMAALAEQVIDGFVTAGAYTDDDASLVSDVMTAGEFPSSLTPREVPTFVGAWLDAAAALRAERSASPDALLARVIRDAPKGAAKMAQGIVAKVNAAKAPPKGGAKKAAKG